MKNSIDISNNQFGRLIAIRYFDHKGQEERWECICKCGNKAIVFKQALRTGNTKSCGCLRKESSQKNKRTHGHSIGLKTTPEYRAWRHAKQRCFNPNNKKYPLYGGRGITMCVRWIANFENFLIDMGPRPEGKTLDRIDVNGHYEPGNCRWATYIEQNRNRRICKS